MPDPLPRHMGLGALLKTVAESTELRTVDVKAVLDKLQAITLERCGKKLRIHMPPELLRAMRRKASPSSPWRPQLPPRRKYTVIDNKINPPPPPPLFRPRGPLRLLHAVRRQASSKPRLRLKPAPPHAIDLT